MQTRSQKWSKTAFVEVSGRKGKPEEAKYNTSCRKMPGLIHQAGLLQALVFQVARDQHGVAYVDGLARARWPDDNAANHKTLIAKAQVADLLEYMALTSDIAEIAHWFRKFAQVELTGDDEEG